MARVFHPKVITTNDLLDGHVVYFTGAGWSGDIAEALVAETEEAAQALQVKSECYPSETVETYQVDVTVKNGVPHPVHFRETFRTRGPSNYFHGKQAEV